MNEMVELPNEAAVGEAERIVKTELKLLVVEDSEDDFLLLELLLRQGGYAPECHRVETAAQLLEALRAESWDLVISDYSLPGFTGLDALRLVQEQRPGLPLIIVSGAISEDAAVAAMRAGAKDYVRKGDMARLLPSIEREVGEAWNRARGEQAALAQARAEDALQQSELRFLQLAEAMPECFWLIDVATRRVVFVNPAYTQIWGERCDDLLTDRMDWLRHVHPEDRERMAAVMEQKAYGGVDEKFRVLRPGGEIRWLHVFTFPMRTASGEVHSVGGVAHDITESMLAEERLVQLAHYDNLTQLPNRLLFRDRLDNALSMAKRNDWKLALIFIDLDRFKVINDTLGHLAGDRLLQEVSRRLRSALRASDTVGRLGGDEFAVLIPKLEENQEAAVVARKIIDVLAAPYALDGNEVFSSGSLGVTVFPSDAEDSENLIRHADTAMYRAKELGRNNYQFYTATMNARALEKMQLEGDLRRALAHDEFVLHFQPKVSCRTGKVFGVEALLRWQHPTRGLVSPADFVPMLEETGLIAPVGQWVLREACRQVALWQRERLPQMIVSVNVSGAQLSSAGLFEQVKSALDGCGLEPQYLELELTESLLMRDAEQAIQTLTRLKNVGVHISVDDFGTGYSSLSYLKRIPLDWVKVDRSFVQDITADPSDASITRAVITMAHNLQLKVIAEGVETEGQLGLLLANKCDAIQGYYFSKPLPPAELAELLKSGRELSSSLLAGNVKQRTLLLVDDEENILMALKRVLRRDGYRILTATSGKEGLDLLSENRVDVIVSDQRMPGMTGVEFLHRVKDIHPELVSIVLSGYTELQSVTDAINEGAIYKFLTKPWDDDHLRANIQEAFRRKEMSDENRRLSLELQAANADLARANAQLGEMVKEKTRRLHLGETVLGTLHEVVQNVPWAIVGVAPDGLVAVANAAAEALFGGEMPIFGRFAEEALPPEMVAWLDDLSRPILDLALREQRYRVSRRPMGQYSSSTGTLLVFEPQPMIATAKQ